ncbi:hypothetical protein D9M69_637980 [compost metagenome]
MMLEANSSTPVNAANSRLGPSRCSDATTCAAWSASIIGAPVACTNATLISATTGTTRPTLPRMAATCERNRWATSSTKRRTAPRW